MSIRTNEESWPVGADGTVLIGSSGWSYRSWRGPFVPDNLPARSHLEYYAKHFCTTELNGVFYRTPSEDSVRGWAEKLQTTLFSPGRRRSSSHTGNGSTIRR